MKFSDLPLHHAVLITRSDRKAYANSLWNEISSLSLAHAYFDQTVLDIDTARKILSWAHSPYNKERIALISFHTAGIPAQNAMLKILEEPRAGTRFVLLTSNREGLIETVLSRVHHVHLDTPLHGGTQKMAEEFLGVSPSSRMKLPGILDMLEKTDEEGRKDREAVKEFILSLAATLQAKKAKPRHIEETLEMASYASDPSASGKALLEYLSLLLPSIK